MDGQAIAQAQGKSTQEQKRPASTTTVVAQRVAAEPVPKFVEPKEIYNAGAYAKPLEVGLLRREQTKRMADIMMRTGNVYKAMELRGVLDTMDNQLYKMQGDQGVAEFLQSGGRDANRMMGVYSYYTNQQYQLQPRRDGLFNLVANGQVVSQGMPAEKVVERIRLTLDEGFRQQQAAIAGKLFDSDIKIREQSAKTMGEYIKDIGIKTIDQTICLGQPLAVLLKNSNNLGISCIRSTKLHDFGYLMPLRQINATLVFSPSQSKSLQIVVANEYLAGDKLISNIG
jgi:hypothetical protein